MQKIVVHLNFAKGFRGGERQTLLLIQELSKVGIHQKLLVRKNSALTQRLKTTKNLTIIEIAKPYILSIKQIKDATLIHAHETKALQFAYFAHKITRIPYIVTRRVDNKIKNNFLNKKLYNSASRVVALSHAIKKEIIKVAPNANIEIIPSAFTGASLNQNSINKIRSQYKDKFIIGHVGALDDGHKGQSFLIKAAKILEKPHPDMHFVFVGGGADENILKSQAKSLKNVTFEGFVNNVNDFISCFDLFVFPSRNEGLGSILFDVMQLNVPIIASNVGGIPDIIHDKKNGLLIPTCDENAIVQAILTLYNDKRLREALSVKAKNSIDKYSTENMKNRYLDIYHLEDS